MERNARGRLALGRWCRWTGIWNWKRKWWVEIAGKDLQWLRLVAQGLWTGLCYDQGGTPEQVEVWGCSGAGVEAMNCAGEGTERTPGKDIWESHLSLTAASTSSCYSSLGTREEYFTSCRTVYFVFSFCGGLGSGSVTRAIWQRWGIFYCRSPDRWFRHHCHTHIKTAFGIIL